MPIAGTPVGTDVYVQMLRSHDDGVAEFLDLARVKPNTLGHTRMLLELEADTSRDPGSCLRVSASVTSERAVTAPPDGSPRAW